jgi:hypothetical protein
LRIGAREGVAQRALAGDLEVICTSFWNQLSYLFEPVSWIGLEEVAGEVVLDRDRFDRGPAEAVAQHDVEHGAVVADREALGGVRDPLVRGRALRDDVGELHHVR